MRIAVTTPTGHVGSRVAEVLVEAGEDVVLLARDAGRIAPAVRARATVRTGALTDAAHLREATADVDALFLVVPPPGHEVDDWAAFQRAIGRAAADAVRANGVRRVVLLSSMGAHRDDLYAISRLGEIEGWLNEAAPDVAALRAGYFLENLFGAVPTIAGMGMVFQPSRPEQRLPFVATRDIADVAARWLRDGAWAGHHVVPVHGAADLSWTEAVEILSRALERPVGYAEVTDAQVREALAAAGLPRVMVEEYPKLFGGLRDADYEREPRTPAATTPTTLEAWARAVLRPAVDAAGAPAPAA